MCVSQEGGISRSKDGNWETNGEKKCKFCSIDENGEEKNKDGDEEEEEDVTTL